MFHKKNFFIFPFIFSPVFLLFCCFFIPKNNVFGQILADEASKKLASQTLDYIYGLNFAKATQNTNQLAQKYPSHPVIPFLKAYIISWQNYPLQKTDANYLAFEKNVKDCIAFAENILQQNKQDKEGNYFAMMGYSLLAIHESEGGSFNKSVVHGKNAYSHLKKGFDWGESYPDFYFSTGLYKYYAKQYPDTHPIARPVMLFFPGGNKTEGLNFLQKAAKISWFSKIESFIYLTSIYAKYEKNYKMAMLCSQRIHNTYKSNPFFALKYCENLLLTQDYAKAETIIPYFSNQNATMYQVATATFNGILQEKYYKNNQKAMEFYQKAITYTNVDVRYTKDIQAFADFGLGRVYKMIGNFEKSKEHLRKARKNCEYLGILEEIQQWSN